MAAMMVVHSGRLLHREEIGRAGSDHSESREINGEVFVSKIRHDSRIVDRGFSDRCSSHDPYRLKAGRTR